MLYPKFFTSILLSTVSFATANPLSLNTTAAIPDSGDFLGSCEDSNMEGSILIAQCMNNFDSLVYSSINLDYCLQAGGGVLSAGSTGYYESCEDCEYSTRTDVPILTCSCVNDEDEYTVSDINLNNVVGNRDGVLTC